AETDGEWGWIERAAGSEAEARWEFAELSAARMRGTWRQGRRSLPFHLAPVPWAEGEWGGLCSSEAYLAPRLRSRSEVRREPARLGDFAFVRHAFVPPGHLRDDVTIETFQFEPERPGDPAILAALRSRLPGGTMADPFADCLAGAITAHGTDG